MPDHSEMIAGMIIVFGIVAIAAYFCGCFNGAVIASRFILKDDVRKHGSGNAGLTNFYRVFGAKYAALVILSDVLKAVVAVLIGAQAFRIAGLDPVLGKYWAAVFCMLGHMYPCMFGFKGGKGVLSGGTVVLMIDWRIALVAWGGFLLLAILTRWVSLGSIWAGASFPVTTWFIFHDPVLLILAFISGGLLVWRHHGNIGRLLKGTEPKFSFHGKKEKS